MSEHRLRRLAGSMTALVTPFRGDFIDEAAFVHLCERQIERGTTALVPCSVTGESPTLDADEQVRAIRLAVEASRGRVEPGNHPASGRIAGDCRDGGQLGRPAAGGGAPPRLGRGIPAVVWRGCPIARLSGTGQPVAANIVPALCATLHRAWSDYDRALYQELRDPVLTIKWADQMGMPRLV